MYGYGGSEMYADLCREYQNEAAWDAYDPDEEEDQEEPADLFDGAFD